MSLCLAAGGKIAALAFTAFTLSWTHSVEHIRWEEDWHLTPAGLTLVQARVKGTGAGMEPPPEARLDRGWWRWQPQLKPQSQVVLAASGKTGAGWTLCGDNGDCREIGRQAADPLTLGTCADLRG